MSSTATKITVYWDVQDSANEGWAYRLSHQSGEIASGAIDADDLDAAIEQAIVESGLEITVDAFAKEPNLDGGYAIWTASDE